MLHETLLKAFIKINSLGIHYLINAVAVTLFDILKLDSTQAILNIANWKSLSGRGEINKIYFDDLLGDFFILLMKVIILTNYL